MFALLSPLFRERRGTFFARYAPVRMFCDPSTPVLCRRSNFAPDGCSLLCGCTPPSFDDSEGTRTARPPNSRAPGTPNRWETLCSRGDGSFPQWYAPTSLPTSNRADARRENSGTPCRRCREFVIRPVYPTRQICRRCN